MNTLTVLALISIFMQGIELRYVGKIMKLYAGLSVKPEQIKQSTCRKPVHVDELTWSHKQPLRFSSMG